MNYGQPNDLAARIQKWSDQSRFDSAAPWLGLGFVADMDLAAKQLGDYDRLRQVLTSKGYCLDTIDLAVLVEMLLP